MNRHEFAGGNIEFKIFNLHNLLVHCWQWICGACIENRFSCWLENGPFHATLQKYTHTQKGKHKNTKLGNISYLLYLYYIRTSVLKKPFGWEIKKEEGRVCSQNMWRSTCAEITAVRWLEMMFNACCMKTKQWLSYLNIKKHDHRRSKHVLQLECSIRWSRPHLFLFYSVISASVCEAAHREIWSEGHRYCKNDLMCYDWISAPKWFQSSRGSSYTLSSILQLLNFLWKSFSSRCSVLDATISWSLVGLVLGNLKGRWSPRRSSVIRANEHVAASKGATPVLQNQAPPNWQSVTHQLESLFINCGPVHSGCCRIYIFLAKRNVTALFQMFSISKMFASFDSPCSFQHWNTSLIMICCAWSCDAALTHHLWRPPIVWFS